MKRMPDIAFDNSYARLPERFFARLAPEPVTAPRLLVLNEALADHLGLDADYLRSQEGLAALSGNALPPGAAGIAQAYAGHQFGGFVPQLGDGRALLLGEIVDPDGRRFDLQLKGSGRTPFSRMGDGRAWLGPVLREYVVSEAMAAMGIPTTRALAAVSTGERVQRETGLPGAILTRVAASHIRVGTFEYFAARRDTEALEALAEHARQRHYPDAEGALGLLDGVVAAQADLVAGWMAVGFIHGVMNTDNTAVSGETIDYGPCAFIDAYHPMRVFSSIDAQGRYAYARQPEMALWNLAQFASALLPVIGDREAAQGAIDAFPELYQAAWLARFRAKLGLETQEAEDADLIQSLLGLMADQGADFTRVFRGLGDAAAGEFTDREAFEAWESRWAARLMREGAAAEDRRAAMRRVNPAIIPRNHRIEEMIAAAVQGDMAPFERLTDALANPFEATDEGLARAPREDQVVARTFCGT